MLMMFMFIVMMFIVMFMMTMFTICSMIMILNHDDVYAYSDDVCCDVFDDDVYNMLYDG